MLKRLLFALIVVVPLLGAGPCDFLFGATDCAADTDCPGDEFCIDGTCQQCEHDSDCRTGEICRDGTCRRDLDGGEGDAGEGEGEGDGTEGEGDGGEGEGEGDGTCLSKCDCSAGQVCTDFVCSAPGSFCFNDEDCPRGNDVCNAFICDNSFTCVDRPAEGEGEGEGEGGEGEGEGDGCDLATLTTQCETNGQFPDVPNCGCTNTDVCSNHLDFSDQCDCGCGQADSDCGGQGCTTPGCGAPGCVFCWDTNGGAITCPTQ